MHYYLSALLIALFVILVIVIKRVLNPPYAVCSKPRCIRYAAGFSSYCRKHIS